MVAELDCSPTGYLRAGKLLQRTGQWDEAVEMYKLGMDKCSDPDAKRVSYSPSLTLEADIRPDVGGDARKSSRSAELVAFYSQKRPARPAAS